MPRGAIRITTVIFEMSLKIARAFREGLNGV